MSQPKAGSEAMKSGSLKGVFGLAVLAVLAIVLAGVLLGILPGGDVLTDLRNKIPAIATKSSDGWEEFVQADARFSATMPVDRTEQQVPFQWSTTGTIDQWVSTLGPDDDPDTTLSVQWAPVATPEGENTDRVDDVAVDRLGRVARREGRRPPRRPASRATPRCSSSVTGCVQRQRRRRHGPGAVRPPT